MVEEGEAFSSWSAGVGVSGDLGAASVAPLPRVTSSYAVNSSDSNSLSASIRVVGGILTGILTPSPAPTPTPPPLSPLGAIAAPGPPPHAPHDPHEHLQQQRARLGVRIPTVPTGPPSRPLGNRIGGGVVGGSGASRAVGGPKHRFLKGAAYTSMPAGASAPSSADHPGGAGGHDWWGASTMPGPATAGTHHDRGCVSSGGLDVAPPAPSTFRSYDSVPRKQTGRGGRKAAGARAPPSTAPVLSINMTRVKAKDSLSMTLLARKKTRQGRRRKKAEKLQEKNHQKPPRGQPTGPAKATAKLSSMRPTERIAGKKFCRTARTRTHGGGGAPRTSLLRHQTHTLLSCRAYADHQANTVPNAACSALGRCSTPNRHRADG